MSRGNSPEILSQRILAGIISVGRLGAAKRAPRGDLKAGRIERSLKIGPATEPGAPIIIMIITQMMIMIIRS